MTNTLSKAIQKKDKEMVAKLILDSSINLNAPSDIDPRSSYKEGIPPLLEAIAQDSEDLAIMILDSGRANPNISTSKGSTPLMTAIVKKQSQLVSKLLAHKPPVDLWAKKYDTTIMNAALKENFLSHRKNYIDQLPPRNFNTALDYAAQSNQHDIVEKIIYKAKDTQKSNIEHYTNALLIAATYGSEESAFKLITHGADTYNPHILTCAAASEQYQKEEKNPVAAAEKAALFVDSLIKKGVGTEHWTYQGNNPGIKVIYLRTQLEYKSVTSLATSEYKQHMQELMQLVLHRVNPKLHDQGSAIIARIAYAHYLKEKKECDLITACRYWSKIKNLNHLNEVDRKLISETERKPPIWIRGSAFNHISQQLFRPSLSMKQMSKTENPKSNQPSAAFDRVIDDTLRYLETRNSETRSRWFGYSKSDYQLRRQITDKVTLYKLAYRDTQDVTHLYSIKAEIESALEKKEITGRYCFSSHRFADHLRRINDYISTIPEFKIAEEKRMLALRNSLFQLRVN